MKFKIQPQSGHSDSYLDIQFSVDLDANEPTTIEIINLTINEPVEIVSINRGVIVEGTQARVKNTTTVEGYVNLFSRDKMNVQLSSLPYVDILCRATTESSITEKSARFYNESLSLDGTVTPFDLIIENPEIDSLINEPLRLHLISDTEKKYELCIMNPNRIHMCTIEVIAKKGKTSFSVPSEVIWKDCNISSPGKQDLRVYWVKFEGIDQFRFRNRKYIPIEGSSIRFKSRTMMPKPQNRLGPTGEPLPDDFVLSDRYYVPTWKYFTSLGQLPEVHPQSRQVHFSVFLHEYQSVQTQPAKVEAMSEIGAMSAERANQALPRIREGDQPLQTMLIGAFAAVYDKKSQLLPVSNIVQNTQRDFKVQTMSAQEKPGGCGCSRKS